MDRAGGREGEGEEYWLCFICVAVAGLVLVLVVEM